MTDRNAPTTPPPGPLPSTLPDDMAHNPAETFAIGRALDGLSEVDRYLRGRCDGVVAAAVAKMADDERKARDEFRAEMREKIDTLLSMQANLSSDVLEYVQKVVAVDFRQREHERGNPHCENADCEFRKLAKGMKEG